jgi:hypothetical protein
MVSDVPGGLSGEVVVVVVGLGLGLRFGLGLLRDKEMQREHGCWPLHLAWRVQGGIEVRELRSRLEGVEV